MAKNDRTKAILDRAFKELEGVAEPVAPGVRSLIGGARALIDADAAVAPAPPPVAATPAVAPAVPTVAPAPAAVPAVAVPPATATERPLPVPSFPPKVWNSVEERRRKLQESSSLDRAKVESSQTGRPHKGQ